MQTPNWRERVREEFKTDGIYGVGISTWANGDIDFTASADGISDWWIFKMEQVEKETIERAIEVVREVEYGADTTEEMGNYKRKVFEALKTLLH